MILLPATYTTLWQMRYWLGVSLDQELNQSISILIYVLHVTQMFTMHWMRRHLTQMINHLSLHLWMKLWISMHFLLMFSWILLTQILLHLCSRLLLLMIHPHLQVSLLSMVMISTRIQISSRAMSLSIILITSIIWFQVMDMYQNPLSLYERSQR